MPSLRRSKRKQVGSLSSLSSSKKTKNQHAKELFGDMKIPEQVDNILDSHENSQTECILECRAKQKIACISNKPDKYSVAGCTITDLALEH